MQDLQVGLIIISRYSRSNCSAFCLFSLPGVSNPHQQFNPLLVRFYGGFHLPHCPVSQPVWMTQQNLWSSCAFPDPSKAVLLPKTLFNEFLVQYCVAVKRGTLRSFQAQQGMPKLWRLSVLSHQIPAQNCTLPMWRSTLLCLLQGWLHICRPQNFSEIICSGRRHWVSCDGGCWSSTPIFFIALPLGSCIFEQTQKQSCYALDQTQDFISVTLEGDKSHINLLGECFIICFAKNNVKY